MENLKLVYIHEFGKTWDEVFVYQFLFSDKEDVDGENWDAVPANKLPSPPTEDKIQLIGELRSGYIFDLLQNSTSNCMWDGYDRVIPLAIENIEDYDLYPEKRLYFRYGDTKKEVEDMLYNNDLILKYIKNE